MPSSLALLAPGGPARYGQGCIRRLARILAGCSLVACVGDSTPIDAGSDATTSDSGGNDVNTADASDAGVEACATIPNQPGVNCFNAGRCAVQTQECCIGSSGGGFIGACADAGAMCQLPYFPAWDCDTALDCNNGNKCCVSAQAQGALFAGLVNGGCPIVLVIPMDGGPGSDASPPSTIASCSSSCGSNPQLCGTSAECSNGLKCTPVEFPSTQFPKIFGVCLP
jgi:hypothetical protein